MLGVGVELDCDVVLLMVVPYIRAVLNPDTSLFASVVTIVACAAC